MRSLEPFKGQHKYNPEHGVRGASFLNHFFRRWLFPPERILNDIDQGIGKVWADIGCGSGFFTIPLASRASQVYAIDISPTLLGILARTISGKNIDNILPILSQENKIPLEKERVDVAFLAYVTHELDSPQEFFKQLAPILKPDGRVVIIEFSQSLSLGPPMKERISPEQADHWFKQIGLYRSNTWRWNRSTIGLEYRFLH
jgi:ubiquinone/menaquinone biosynthesis C-methylase UbiE